MKNKTITVKLKKSTICCTENMKAQIRGLGLRKTNTVRTLENTPAVRGMIKKAIHLLEIVEK